MSAPLRHVSLVLLSLLLQATPAIAADLVAQNVETVGTVVGDPTFAATRFSSRTMTTTVDGQGLVVPHGPETTAVAGDFGISFWFRLEQSFTGELRVITFKGNNANERTFAVFMRPNDNRIAYRISTTSNDDLGGSSNAALEIGQWTHLAWVRRGNRLELYINGRRDAVETISGATEINTGPLYLGDTPFHAPALGSLAGVTIYQRQVTRLEPRSMYKAYFPDNNMEEQGTVVGTPVFFNDVRTVADGLRLDSVDDGVRLPDSILTTPESNEFSIAFWVRVEAGPTGQIRSLIHKGDTEGSSPYALWLRAQDNRIEFRSSSDTDPSLGGVSNAELPLNEWTHITYVKREVGNRLELFINGISDRVVPIEGDIRYNDGPLYVGSTPWSDAAIAAVDDLSTYNYRLEQVEAARYAAEVRRSVAEEGSWGPIIPWPHVPVSVANLPDGRILSWSGSERTTWPTPERTYSAVYDPATGEFDDLFQQGHNMFCAHLALTETGQVFVNGGRNETNSPYVSLFDFRNNRWTQIEDMATGGRWYPVTNALPNGEIMTSMGTSSNFANPEKWSPITGWSVMNSVNYFDMRTRRGGVSGESRWWAILSVAPNGDVFHYWDNFENHFIDTDGTGAVRPANAVVTQNLAPGVAIQYDAGRLLMSGGNQGSWSLHGDNTRALTIDLNAPSPLVEPTGAMNVGRTYHNLIPLPNGEVIALGGSLTDGSFNNRGAVYQAEIWNPQTGQWRLVAPASVPRTYHSTGLLMPDARVLSAGGGYDPNSEFADGSSHQNAQFYSPPYLYDATGALASRPTITSGPGVIRPGETFTIQGSADITRFSMIRMSSTTHAVNTDSRFTWVPATANGDGSYNLTPTANINVLLPGYWMLFGLDANDVPSVAHVVRVARPITVTTPGDIQYVRLVAKSEVNGNPWTSVAELNILDAQGNPIDRSAWVVSADSEETGNGGDGLAALAVDGDPATYWHTDFRTNDGVVNDPAHDHTLTVDLSAGYALTALEYLPRQDNPNGRILDYDIEVSTDGQAWTLAAQGQFLDSPAAQVVTFSSDPGAVVVQQAAPTAAGASVSFTATNGAPGYEYNFVWGDGTETGFSEDPVGTHSYATAGRYVVVVTVRDPGSGQSSTFTITHLVHDARIDVGQPQRWLSSTRIAYHPTLAQVWNVNPDNDTVTVIESTTFVRLAEVPVEDLPSSIAFDDAGRAWVSNKESGSISVIDPASFAVLQTVVLPNANARPHGLLNMAGGNRMLVALEGTGEVTALNATTYAVEGTMTAIPNARHLARQPTGSAVIVTSFITPPVPNENTALPDVSAGTEAVAAIDAATMQLITRFPMNHSDRVRSENSGPGLPNYLASAAVHPAGDSLYIPSKQDNLLGGSLRQNGPLTFDQAVRAVSSYVEFGTFAEYPADRIEHDNASVASAASFGPYGLHLFTALEGNRQVAISVPQTDSEIARFDVGRGPQGLALSPDGMTLAVYNFMDRSVQFVDISNIVRFGQATVPPTLATVPTVAIERLDAVVLAGKQLFYDARDDRLAALDYMACASCHENGGGDGRVWDFTQFGEGLRNTINLRGRGGMSHGLLHWTGNFNEVQDFEAQIRNFAGGLGLMTDAEFFAGTRAEPFGDDKAGLSADLDALATYVASLNTADRRTRPGTELSAAAQRGAEAFTQLGCVGCHADGVLTDSPSGVRHDVGTLTAASGQRLNQALDGLDTPTVLGLSTSAPYLHDGSAPTVQAAIQAHTAVATTVAQRDDIAAYLLELVPLPPPTVETEEEITQLGTPISYAVPAGAGNPSLETIRDGDLPPLGSADPLRQFDTWNGEPTRAADWVGYTYSANVRFTRVEFQEGIHFSEGGWFETGTLIVQVRQGGVWVDVTGFSSTPAYPGAGGASFASYTLNFDVISGDGIRIYGAPGGVEDFISVGELQVFAFLATTCGNGTLDAGETCDDGNAAGGDGCSASCQTEFCGDGVVNNVAETCEPPNTNTCNATCTARQPTCGDGFVTAPEACDDGNVIDGDGCSSTCEFEPAGQDLTDFGTIVARVTAPTGGGNRDLETIRDDDRPPVTATSPQRHYDTYDGDAPAATDWIGYTFGADQLFGRVVFQEGLAFGDGGFFDTLGVQVRQGGVWVDVPNVIITPPYAGNNGVNFETYELAFTPIAGDGIRIFGNPGGSADFITVAELEVFASAQATNCGDGVVETGEQCDDGNTTSGDGCDRFCQTEFCGDGVINNVTETCEPPGTATCDDSCIARAPTCGDGFVTAPETCEPPGSATCNETCVARTQVCGDNFVTAPETCDDGNTVDGDGCPSDCGISVPESDLTDLGTVIARVVAPQGLGSRDLEILRDNDMPLVGSFDFTRQYDTWDGDDSAPEDWFGYTYTTQYAFSRVVFQEGMHFDDGGWFDSLTVQVRRGGAWITATNVAFTPAYPGANAFGFETYEITFDAEIGDAIRIYGDPGGATDFVSIAELEVYGRPVVP